MPKPLPTADGPIPLTGARSCLAAAILAIAALAAGVATAEYVQPSVEGNDGPAAETDRPQKLMREGDKITSQSGFFKAAGTRMRFSLVDGSRHFLVLENLGLERVAKIVAEQSDPSEWIVSGTITEFQGQNYLLVTRAMRKARLERGAPGD
jgi:hypothetical protein